MNQNIEAIRNHLLSGLASSSVEYQNSSGCHKFKIVSSGPSHWLYISHEIVEDSEPVILINLINIYKIVESFNEASESKWLYFGSNGIKEVDEHFTK